ncbi:MAG: zinc ribbon domain-containing protein [Oscillospiraceae bacterium]
MGFLLKAIGVGLAVASINKIKSNAEEENRRKNTVCHFDEGITKEEFYVMVKLGGKGIRRLTSLYADGTIAYGTVRSQSGLSEWCFKIDFNDYGHLTGKYWLKSENSDSSIPKIVADRIADQIKAFPDCPNDIFDDEVDAQKRYEESREYANAFCPYCGKKMTVAGAKFCGYCGRRFRV